MVGGDVAVVGGTKDGGTKHAGRNGLVQETIKGLPAEGRARRLKVLDPQPTILFAELIGLTVDFCPPSGVRSLILLRERSLGLDRIQIGPGDFFESLPEVVVDPYAAGFLGARPLKVVGLVWADRVAVEVRLDLWHLTLG